MSAHSTQPLGAGAPEPIAVTLPEAQRISGLSRSLLYRLAGRGELVFRKCGSRVVVPMKSLEELIAGLPPASIKMHFRDRKAAVQAHRAAQFRQAR